MTTSPAQIRVVGTINMQPTWEGMVRLFIAILEDGDADGKATARAELTRMAKIADRYVAEHAPKEPEDHQ